MRTLIRARLRPPPRPNAIDATLAVVFAAGAQLELWVSNWPGSTGAGLVGAIFTTVPLAWRSCAPVVTMLLTTSGYALAVVLGMHADEPVVTGLAPLLAVYSLGARASARGIVVGTLGGLAAYAVAAAAPTTGERSDLVVTCAAMLGALVVGGAVRVMGFESEVLQARAAELERERDEKAATAVAQERARIARELHDVIGHSISVMGVQAGAVRRRLTTEQEHEREALLAVERVGRDAVAEMRRLLGFLRADDESAPAAALPTLQRVDDLVAEMRRAGLEIELQIDGDIDGLPPGRALAAFRVIQEALTNALKHAPDAHVLASLRSTADALEIEVLDDGGGGAAAGVGSDGQGLVGMRERMAMYGGDLDAGPRPGGGFAVVARLPIGGR